MRRLLPLAMLVAVGLGSAGCGAMVGGVAIHDYVRPSSYGYTAATGGDRLGAALVNGNVTRVRGADFGDVAFLQRLASFRRPDGTQQVREAILSPGQLKAQIGAPADFTRLAPLVRASVAEARRVGITPTVEGLNEWDLFNGRAYNAGVVPEGWTQQQFIVAYQHALAEAARPLGVLVLGPSVGHKENVGFFPDVSADVDVVNLHQYGVPSADALQAVVRDMQGFQGAGKPVWVTEGGAAAWLVSETTQASTVASALERFRSSGLIARAYLYEAMDGLPAASLVTNPDGSLSFTGWDNVEFHWGLLARYDGTPKPAAAVLRDDNARYP